MGTVHARVEMTHRWGTHRWRFDPRQQLDDQGLLPARRHLDKPSGHPRDQGRGRFRQTSGVPTRRRRTRAPQPLRQGLPDLSWPLSSSTAPAPPRHMSGTTTVAAPARPYRNPTSESRSTAQSIVRSTTRWGTDSQAIAEQPPRVSVLRNGGLMACLTRHGYLGRSISVRRPGVAQGASVCRTDARGASSPNSEAVPWSWCRMR